MIKVYYRLSDRKNRSGLSKTPPFMTTKECLKNFIKNFELDENVELHIIGDNIGEETENWLKETKLNYEKTSLGNIKSFDYVIKHALNSSLNDETIVYFVEGDYVHKKNSKYALLEAFEYIKADYVTLYDSPDMYDIHYNVNYDGYINTNEANWENYKSRVYAGKYCYWKTIMATTMTFATKIKTLKQDYHLIKHSCTDTTYQKYELNTIEYPTRPGCGCNDYQLFKTLTKAYDRLLISPMPGFASHGDILSPHVKWINEM